MPTATYLFGIACAIALAHTPARSPIGDRLSGHIEPSSLKSVAFNLPHPATSIRVSDSKNVADGPEPQGPTLKHPRLSIWGGMARGILVLGSEDPRYAWVAGIDYARPERKFRIGRAKGELVTTAYLNWSGSYGTDMVKPVSSTEFGVLALARYRFTLFGDDAWYVDLGWGLQITSRESHDLDSSINSTPSLGLGIITRTGGHELTMGFRYLHASNAHTKGRNKGQNLLLFTVGWSL